MVLVLAIVVVVGTMLGIEIAKMIKGYYDELQELEEIKERLDKQFEEECAQHKQMIKYLNVTVCNSTIDLRNKTIPTIFTVKVVIENPTNKTLILAAKLYPTSPCLTKCADILIRYKDICSKNQIEVPLELPSNTTTNLEFKVYLHNVCTIMQGGEYYMKFVLTDRRLMCGHGPSFLISLLF